jgi:hypothetical protein
MAHYMTKISLYNQISSLCVYSISFQQNSFYSQWWLFTLHLTRGIFAQHINLQQETILNHFGGPVHPKHPSHVELKVHRYQYPEQPPVHKHTNCKGNDKVAPVTQHHISWMFIGAMKLHKVPWRHYSVSWIISFPI